MIPVACCTVCGLGCDNVNGDTGDCPAHGAVMVIYHFPVAPLDAALNQ